eukprot:TRINITY_DN5654_c0_g2_i1.p1 TRINITY_DN5654_c0_g2~~TRINITY_DN5654_c0_g2_i1.p1  ORF type:complete len:698 (-),score=218.24 TRINITY_DN5654_c0_g2_i1:99-2081(-)
MTADNLAVVFGPCLIFSLEPKEALGLFSDSSTITSLVTKLIENHELLKLDRDFDLMDPKKRKKLVKKQMKKEKREKESHIDGDEFEGLDEVGGEAVTLHAETLDDEGQLLVVDDLDRTKRESSLESPRGISTSSLQVVSSEKKKDKKSMFTRSRSKKGISASSTDTSPRVSVTVTPSLSSSSSSLRPIIHVTEANPNLNAEDDTKKHKKSKFSPSKRISTLFKTGSFVVSPASPSSSTSSSPLSSSSVSVSVSYGPNTTAQLSSKSVPLVMSTANVTISHSPLMSDQTPIDDVKSVPQNDEQQEETDSDELVLKSIKDLPLDLEPNPLNHDRGPEDSAPQPVLTETEHETEGEGKEEIIVLVLDQRHQEVASALVDDKEPDEEVDADEEVDDDNDEGRIAYVPDPSELSRFNKTTLDVEHESETETEDDPEKKEEEDAVPWWWEPDPQPDIELEPKSETSKLGPEPFESNPHNCKSQLEAEVKANTEEETETKTDSEAQPEEIPWWWQSDPELDLAPQPHPHPEPDLEFEPELEPREVPLWQPSKPELMHEDISELQEKVETEAKFESNEDDNSPQLELGSNLRSSIVTEIVELLYEITSQCEQERERDKDQDQELKPKVELDSDFNGPEPEPQSESKIESEESEEKLSMPSSEGVELLQ